MADLTDLEWKVYDEAKRHIFSIDADVYRQITGRSLTDVEFIQLVAGSSIRKDDDDRTFPPVIASKFAIIKLYESMKREGIEYALGLKMEIFPYGGSGDNHVAIAYATGLRQKSG